ncbi:sensor histidine kinase [Arsenicibacter rosenii]|uniref:Signal transduction histidine kinase internal region domain-containing protein n=1 Tax=Arsenicibacter rosenii TaxID=1750698 RepID=A0A1S2V9W4_9BACT|nr:histidine kinase [Arsenicibacter rosenii]OIN55527.1 hypothetical protein BLX24_29750 [Arsenicibacter rosenii]
MRESVTYRLTLRQSGALALSLALIFDPIIVYVNAPERSIAFFLSAWQFLLVEFLFTFLIFFAWIVFSEWVLDALARRFGEDFLIDFKLPGQFLLLSMAIGAALSFNAAKSETLFKHIGPMLWPRAEHKPRKPRLRTEHNDRWDYFERSNNGLATVMMLAIFYVSANRRANRRLKDIQVQKASLEKETVLAQFTALKNQVSPHFLFNSLSILSSLVHINPDLSEQFIDQLSRAYRYILDQKDNDRVSLKTELTFIKSYTFLLKIRFEDSFDVRIELPDGFGDQYSIAPLTLQLLVENAVKHNRMTPKEPLLVTITANKGYLIIRNRLQPREQIETSTGVGLQNIINRYRLLTDQLVIVGEQEGAFVVKIPLLP